MVQFDERSDKYRCCCECCHVKNVSFIIGCVELAIIFYFLVNSLFLIAETDFSGASIPKEELGLVTVPFWTCMAGLAVGTLAIFLLFLAVVKKYPACVLPHFIIQVLSVPVFLGLVVCAALALATDRTVFYRLLNASSFPSTPDNNVVSLGAPEQAKVFAALVVYSGCLLLELWFSVVVWRFYVYLKERSAYMEYCLSYCTPLRTVKVRVPQYAAG